LVVRFEILTAASTKMAVFWVFAPYSLAELYRLSEVLAASIIRAMSTHCSALMMEGKAQWGQSYVEQALWAKP
jgi:hypothetical protein